LTEIWKGAPVAAALNEKTRIQCEKLKGQGIFPTLAIVRVGQREDDLSYERGVKKRCEAVGVGVRQYVLDAAAAQEEVLGVIQEVNADENVHGCLLFRPLPRPLEENEICAALDRDKDVDGITEESLAGVFTGSGVGFAPCTAQAVVEILDYYGVNLTGKRVTVVGRSLVVGKPAAMLLDRKNATVTMCNSRTQNLPDLCREAEVLVVAMGKMGAIGKECFREGQVVVDVGIHMDENGKLRGDVRTEEAMDIVRAITPVPGGVGAMTTAVLVRHVVQAAGRKYLVEEDGEL
jgi:methylenetetrahydrofolate dehydrogenase (NADP+)/methenyltetrahydrofolate cyclohydrolase